jgi:hypothetical protein
VQDKTGEQHPVVTVRVDDHRHSDEEFRVWTIGLAYDGEDDDTSERPTRYYSSYWVPDKGLLLRDLGSRAQSDKRGNLPYGQWERGAYYADSSSVSADKAMAMARTLKTVARKLDAMREEWGDVATLGQWCIRFAHAVGATQLYVSGPAIGTYELNHPEYHNKRYTLREGAQRVDYYARAWEFDHIKVGERLTWGEIKSERAT